MLDKYKLINVPEGGVDHLVNGDRVPVTDQMTDEQAEAMMAAGLLYFEPVEPAKAEPAQKDANGKAGKKDSVPVE
ncbi:MAG: hypothetical protein J7576_18495 [Siphonobacter aquaeclarae]|nr:hypothetical protein [Siphonobacter aquaeclarae]